jgi:hypothetical protein
MSKFESLSGKSIDTILAEAKAAGEADRLIKNPDQEKCDHGVMFDLEAAKKILDETSEDKSDDAALDFIMGPVNATAKIKKLWPRLSGKCPKGCGYNGIAYASYEHYIYGDW